MIIHLFYMQVYCIGTDLVIDLTALFTLISNHIEIKSMKSIQDTHYLTVLDLYNI